MAYISICLSVEKVKRTKLNIFTPKLFGENSNVTDEDQKLSDLCTHIIKNTPKSDSQKIGGWLFLFDDIEKATFKTWEWLSKFFGQITYRSYTDYGKRIIGILCSYCCFRKKSGAILAILYDPREESKRATKNFLVHFWWLCNTGINCPESQDRCINLGDEMLTKINDEVQYLGCSHPKLVCQIVDHFSGDNFSFWRRGQLF